MLFTYKTRVRVPVLEQYFFAEIGVDMKATALQFG